MSRTQPVAKALVSLVAALAAGMIWVPASSAAPGDHIRAGGATLTPSLEVGLEHSTNAYRRLTDPQGGTSLEVVPGLNIEAEGPDATFELDGYWKLVKYLQPGLGNLDRFTDFGAGMGLHVLRQSPLQFEVEDQAGLTSREVARLSSSTAYTAQFRNQLDGMAVIQVGPVLRFDVGGNWEYRDLFVADYDSGGIREFNFSNAYGPSAAAEWTFLPRTAIRADFEYGWLRWNENVLDSGTDVPGDPADVLLPNATWWRASAGLNGRITHRLIVVLSAGYGQATYDEESAGAAATDGVGTDLRGLEGLLLGAQLGWEWAPKEKIAIGYRRDFEDSWFTNYLSYDEVYLFWDDRLGSRIGTHLGGKTRFERYRGELERADLRLRAEADVSYYLQDWAQVGVGGAFDQRGSTEDGVGYTEGEFHVMTRVVY